MKIAFRTLGCKVNQYETEAIKQEFQKKGYEIVSHDVDSTIVDEKSNSLFSSIPDIYIINTCSVTHLAERKSRQYIRKAKKINPQCIVVVTGCYAQVASDEISKIKDVDLIVGTNEKHNIEKYLQELISCRSDICDIHIKRYEELSTYEDLGIVQSMETRTRAHIKIQDGCNRFCSYCIIPYARGNVRSRSFVEIIKEAKELLENGIKEIVLAGINSALYGYDIKQEEGEEKCDIEFLIKSLDELPYDFRIRLSSLEPTVIDSECAKRLLHYEKLCPHLHLSAQSGSDKILKLMNRKYNRDEYLSIVEVLQKHNPLYCITTDIIVGFNGEDEQDFENSLRLIEEAKFGKVHAFKFSKRKGTKAYNMPGEVLDVDKSDRMKRILIKGDEITGLFLDKNNSTIHRVLVEECEISNQDNNDEFDCVGFTENYIKTYFKSRIDMKNQFVDVKLLRKYKDGMKGEII